MRGYGKYSSGGDTAEEDVAVSLDLSWDGGSSGGCKMCMWGVKIRKLEKNEKFFKKGLIFGKKLL